MSLLTIHIASIFLAVAILLLADIQAFSWIHGKKQTLHPSSLKVLHYSMWVALLLLIVTGTLMFLPQYHYLLSKPLFVIKLLFVGMLVTNAVLIGNLMHVAIEKTFASLSKEEKLSLYASGAISTFAWFCVISIGLYLFY
jgi:Na+-transporting NADH:ubiquinone oxidoreductase subunit NqrD